LKIEKNDPNVIRNRQERVNSSILCLHFQQTSCTAQVMTAVSLSRSLAGSVGRPSVCLAAEGAPHPDSRSTAGSQADTNSVGPEPRELYTDALRRPENQRNCPSLTVRNLCSD